MLELLIKDLQEELCAERKLADMLYEALIAQQPYILSTAESDISRVLHAYRQARSINIIP